MAHFAKLDEQNVVRQVIVVRNEDILDANGNESEVAGQAFISSIGLDGSWIQTSYSGAFRGRYAGVGMIYDPALNEFVDPSTNSGE